jgi:4'-phosphopantetheinyl transferase
MRANGDAGYPDRIAPGEVHAWLIDLDAIPDGGDTALSRAELARADSYLVPRDGARFAAGRAWLRVILGRYLDADPSLLEFDRSSGGRPVVAGEHAGRINFSVSRSAGRGMAAVSTSPVGADIEHVRARSGLIDLINATFGAAEARCIAGGCGGSPLRGFYRHWTAKEAYLKATGLGLAGLHTTEVTCGAHPAIRLGGRESGWALSPLDAGRGLAAAIVGRGPVTRCGSGGQ